MNRIILQLFAIGFCYALGQALQCYECKIGLWRLCITSKTTCKDGELCYSGVGKAAKVVEIKMKGCLETSKCNKTEDVTFPGDENSTTIYSMTKTCCEGDLCNAAPGLPGTSGLSLALATVTAVFVANVLVWQTAHSIKCLHTFNTHTWVLCSLSLRCFALFDFTCLYQLRCYSFFCSRMPHLSFRCKRY